MLIVPLCFSAAAPAAERGTAEEAVAMVGKVIAYMKTNGKEKAIAEVNNPKGQFVDRDLYITIGDMNGKNLAHGVNPKLVGKNLMDVKDADGKQFLKERNEMLKTKSKGWYDYKWPHPVTKQIESKSTYFEKYEDVIVACGIYKG